MIRIPDRGFGKVRSRRKRRGHFFPREVVQRQRSLSSGDKFLSFPLRFSVRKFPAALPARVFRAPVEFTTIDHKIISKNILWKNFCFCPSYFSLATSTLSSRSSVFKQLRSSCVPHGGLYIRSRASRGDFLNSALNFRTTR